MKNEKPIKIIPSKGKHKMETRVFARDIHESFCMQPSCKFYKKHAQQGVCHTTDTFVGGNDWSYIDKIIDEAGKAAEEQFKILRKHYKGRQYAKHLESYLSCMWMNEMICMDELVRLRRKVALLENKKRH